MGYMLYLDRQFGNALAFVQTQQHWSMQPEIHGLDKFMTLFTFEPVWSIYLPQSTAYWARHEYVANPFFSLQFWNPIYFVVCVVVIAYGAKQRWLTVPEILLSVGLLGIPYAMQSHRMMMLGHGRFTCIVFPLYIVAGRILSGLPDSFRYVIYTLMGVQLFYWSALFAAGHRVF